MLDPYGMMPNVGAWTNASFLHELVEFAPPPLLRRRISTSSQVFVLRCGMNNWKRTTPGREMQEIGKATELERKRWLPSSHEEKA
jgi:hypothetical protein